MGTNVLKDASDKVKNSAIVIPLTLVFLTMFIVSCALMVEDYTTSRLGYELLPTQKANDWVIPLVALLPQLGQVGFGYVFATDINKRWSLAIAVMLWITDVSTDVFFKANGMGIAVHILATVESIVIYSLGSEIMLATSVGMLILLSPHFFRQLGKLLASLFSGNQKPLNQQVRTQAQGFRSGSIKRTPTNYKPKMGTIRPIPTIYDYENHNSRDD